MTETTITAAALDAGMFLVRVQNIYPSRVFERPINARILAVYPNAVYRDTVTVELDTEYKTVLNLDTDRNVTVR